MGLTSQQKQLAQHIDDFVKNIEESGGGDRELLQNSFLQMGTFKKLMDISTQEQMDKLCETYPYFYRFAKLQETLALAIQDGVFDDILRGK